MKMENFLRSLIVVFLIVFGMWIGFGCTSTGSNNLAASLANATTNWIAYINPGVSTNLIPVPVPPELDYIGSLPVTNTIQSAVAPATKWTAYRSAKFFAHGTPDENTVRENAITTTRAQGLDCIECDARYGMDDELGMHLLKLQHPDQPGYFLRPLPRTDGWFFKAQRAGITRWVHDMGAPTMAQAQRWWFLVKDYTRDELQLCISSATPASVQQYLLNNTNGIGIVVESRAARAEVRP